MRKAGVTITKDRGIELPEAVSPVQQVDGELDERLYQALTTRFGAIEFPRLMMEVDAQVRFSSTLLRRVPANSEEVTAVYGALLAHGMGLDRIQIGRMIPSVSDARLRTLMQVVQEDDRLAEANLSVLQFMRRHPVISQWGRSGLASSDMMTVEASRRLWNSRVNPRTGNYAIGTYTHVLDQWGIAYDQPIVLNQRQAGAAIEEVLLQRLVPIDQLAVDTHGYTDVAMGLARLLGFSLCPRLAMLRERKLYAAVTYGRLVRAEYLCEYFVDSSFRDSIRRVLNHGESVHQLQRTIRPYAIGPKRGRSHDEQRAISGSLSLLANLVMAWNTQKIQQLIDQPGRLRPVIRLEDIAGVGPVTTRHINFRGVLYFPLEEFAEPVMRAPIRVPVAP